MEVSITQFRRQMFDLVNEAMDGGEVWVLHKGRRFKIAPEDKPVSRLSRITSLEVINPEFSGLSDLKDPHLQEEMERAWESDWVDL
jgi:antitoxin (DNA-binding transcriptional repressor) of toxin-antitoxin stability system